MADSKSNKIENRLSKKTAASSLAAAFGAVQPKEDKNDKPADVIDVSAVDTEIKPSESDLKEAQQVIGLSKEMTSAYADIKANNTIAEKAQESAAVSNIPDVVLDVLREMLVGQNVVNSSEFEELSIDEEKLAATLEQNFGTTGRDLVPIITNALMRKNNTAAAYIAQCLPKSAKKCRECMFKDSCTKSLVTYPCRRICITLPADVQEAVNIMFKKTPEFRTMTKSSFITTLLRQQVEQYIPEARRHLDEQMLVNAKMEIESTELLNKLIQAVKG